MGMRGAENERLILPRGSLFRFGPGFLEDFLRFPIATLVVVASSVYGFTRLPPPVDRPINARSCDSILMLHVIRRVLRLNRDWKVQTL